MLWICAHLYNFMSVNVLICLNLKKIEMQNHNFKINLHL